ncbi:hypothetical protein GCM10029992_42800 [Glycomyces albus]
MIGITGSTGGVGSRTVRHLLAEPDCPPLVAIARRPRAVPRRNGLTARGADYDDPASLERAFAGLETLVFVSSDGRAETMARHHRNVIAAAVGAGVGHVVYTSILDIEPDSRFYYSPPTGRPRRCWPRRGSTAVWPGLRYSRTSSPRPGWLRRSPRASWRCRWAIRGCPW